MRTLPSTSQACLAQGSVLTLSLVGTPSPTRTDMNRSSTDFESVALGLKPFITLTFIICINVLYQCFFFKISKNIPLNVERLLKKLTEAQFVRALVCSTGCKEFKSPQPFRFILLRLCKMFLYFQRSILFRG